MFGFDMLVHSVRGDQLPEEELNEAELEVYGVDWEALRDKWLLQSQGITTFKKRAGIPGLGALVCHSN